MFFMKKSIDRFIDRGGLWIFAGAAIIFAMVGFYRISYRAAYDSAILRYGVTGIIQVSEEGR